MCPLWPTSCRRRTSHSSWLSSSSRCGNSCTRRASAIQPTHSPHLSPTTLFSFLLQPAGSGLLPSSSSSSFTPLNVHLWPQPATCAVAAAVAAAGMLCLSQIPRQTDFRVPLTSGFWVDWAGVGSRSGQCEGEREREASARRAALTAVVPFFATTALRFLFLCLRVTFDLWTCDLCSWKWHLLTLIACSTAPLMTLIGPHSGESLRERRHLSFPEYAKEARHRSRVSKARMPHPHNTPLSPVSTPCHTSLFFSYFPPPQHAPGEEGIEWKGVGFVLSRCGKWRTVSLHGENGFCFSVFPSWMPNGFNSACVLGAHKLASKQMRVSVWTGFCLRAGLRSDGRHWASQYWCQCELTFCAPRELQCKHLFSFS